MKRKLVLTVLACLLALMCAACGGDKKNAGTWELRCVEFEGLFAEPDVFGTTALLSLEADGTGRLTVGEYGYAIRSWSLKDGKVKIKTLDGTVEGTFENGYIVLLFEDGVSLRFAKEGSEVPQLALLDEEAFRAAYAALVESGEAMPVD